MATVTDVVKVILSRRPRYFAGGMEPSDFLEVFEGLQTWDDWIKGVAHYAEERKTLAEEALADNRKLSAGKYFIEAGIYYHYAMLGYYEDEKKKFALKQKSVETYHLGIGLINPPIRRLEIPYDGIEMTGHLRLPLNVTKNCPLVFLLPGADSTKEEYFMFSDVLVTYGLGTLALEGPGQGETRESRVMRGMADYEKAFSTAVDYVIDNIKEVAPDKIGVYGRSLGGYLGPIVAAYDKRLRALVSAGGLYDVSHWDSLGESTKNNWRHTFGFENLDEAKEYLLKEITLEGVVQKITCPFLIVHSEKDANAPADAATRMKAEAKCEAELRIYEDGIHVCDNIPYKYQRYVADWLLKKLR